MNTNNHPLCRDRIITDPEILGGKPVIKGTRIPVTLVLERLAHDLDLPSLLKDYPRLTEDDVKACLGYAHALAEAELDRTLPHRPFDPEDADVEEFDMALRDVQEAWADVNTDELIAMLRRARQEGSRGYERP